MTREEKIAELINIRDNFNYTLAPREVFDDAIKALKQEPITSKDKFIYGLTACGCLLKDGKTWYEHNELIKCFEDLGLFEQEPRKGHWINMANPRMSDNIVCSECGYDSIADFKFCPCCGADMREVEE